MAETEVKANIQEMGHIMTMEAPDGHPPDNDYKFAMVIEFESREDLHRALEQKSVELNF